MPQFYYTISSNQIYTEKSHWMDVPYKLYDPFIIMCLYMVSCLLTPLLMIWFFSLMVVFGFFFCTWKKFLSWIFLNYLFVFINVLYTLSTTRSVVCFLFFDCPLTDITLFLPSLWLYFLCIYPPPPPPPPLGWYNWPPGDVLCNILLCLFWFAFYFNPFWGTCIICLSFVNNSCTTDMWHIASDIGGLGLLKFCHKQDDITIYRTSTLVKFG